MENIWILSIALALDILVGEIPGRLHPVAWLGSFISFQLKFAPATGPRRQLAFGLIVVLFTILILIVPAAFFLYYLGQLSTIVYVITAALVLKSTFALRGLWQAVGEVGRNLQSGDILSARNSARSLVSRDTGALDEKGIVAASVESCAENLCDSFIAPTFYFMIFGPAGALAYRVINTFDSMIGYHGSWEYTGKFAARLDDVVNYIPARLSGIMLTGVALISGNKARRAWQTMLAEHGRTESPNAGWTMAAMAGSLGVALEKEGHYRLGTPTREIAVDDIGRSRCILVAAARIWSTIILVVEVVKLAAIQAMR